LIACRSRRRAWITARSAGPRCSRLRSTIEPIALLHRPVLDIDAVDPGEALRPLHAAIKQVVVLAVAPGPEGRLVDVERAIAEAALEAILSVKGSVVLYSQL
jgi:hypothetical protein